MLVSEAMGGPVDTCAADAKVGKAAPRITDEDHGALPVTSHERLIAGVRSRNGNEA